MRHVFGVALLLGSQLASAAEVQGASESHEQFAGVWQIESPVFSVRTTTGDVPPLREAADRVYRDHIEARKQGDTSFDSATWCASVGMPRLMFVNSPFEIMIGPKHVAFMHEWNWWARVVYLRGALTPTAPARTHEVATEHHNIGGLPPVENVMTSGAVGLSRGEWHRDELVVKTDHLSDTTLIDGAGIPHSGDLKLTETLRLRDRDTLEDRIRFEDPITFTRPWETVVIYKRKPGVRIREDVCLDRIKAGEPAVKE
jgi:hypothetical protein